MDKTDIHSLAKFYKEKVDELQNFSTRREVAFTVYSDAAGKGLKNILAQKENWNELCCWNTELQCKINWDKIYIAFNSVEEANISKKEFRDTLKEAKEHILAYEEKLKKEISEIEAEIDKYYDDNFVPKTASYNFFFEADAIKRLIIDILLLGKK